MNEYKLTENDLLAQAIQVKNIRAQFETKARILEDAAGVDIGQDFGSRTRIGMKYSTKARSKDDLSEEERRIILAQDKFPAGKYRKRPLKELSIEDRVDIIHAFQLKKREVLMLPTNIVCPRLWFTSSHRL